MFKEERKHLKGMPPWVTHSISTLSANQSHLQWRKVH